MNIDENPVTPTNYGIRGIPTLLLFKNSEYFYTYLMCDSHLSRNVELVFDV